MRKVDLLWLAAWLEGEGSFGCWSMTSKPYLRLVVTAVSTDYDVIEHIHQLAGGSVHEKRRQQAHHKRSWQWELTGKKAAALMRRILPFMFSRRRAQIMQALSLYENRFTTAISSTVDPLQASVSTVRAALPPDSELCEAQLASS